MMDNDRLTTADSSSLPPQNLGRRICYPALCYGLLAGLWVFVSDIVLLQFTLELSDLAWISTIKGLGFVAVTTVLLYVTLAHERATQDRIDHARRTSEARYWRLAENAPDVIYRYRLGSRPGFEYMSPAVTQITGYQPEMYYAEPQLGHAFVEPFGDGRDSASVRPQVVPLTHREGRVIWIECHMVPLHNASGAIIALEGIARDVTERQQSAAQLRLLELALSATASAVVITDRDGVIQWINPAFTALTGYERDEVIGGTPRLLYSGRQERAFFEQLWTTILSGAVWRGELVNRRKDGSLYHEEQTITPVRSEGGAITHFIGFKQDVSTRVAREREQRVLATLALALRTATNRAQLPRTCLEQLSALLPIDGAALVLANPYTGALVVEAGVGEWASLQGQSFDPPEHGASAPVSVCTSLRVGDETIGALWTRYPSAPDDVERRILTAVADMAASALQRASLHEQTTRRLQRLSGLHALDQVVVATQDMDRALAAVLDLTIAQLAVDAASVLLLDVEGDRLRYHAGRGFRTALAQTPVSLDSGLLGEAARAMRAVRLPTIPVRGDSFTRGPLLDAEDFVAYFALPLVAKGQLKGVLELFHRAPLNPDPEWLSFLETLVGQAAIAIDNAELVERLQRANDELARAYDSTLEGWARALELRDSETEGHSRRVTALSVELARAVGVPEEELVHLWRGALLHDIGKMGVPDAILRKPGPLSDEEWAVMREHPNHAYRLLSPIAYLRPALEIPYAHHERWDGSGYPRRLAGEAIPLAARIFAVVDVWDALTTDRPYRAAWGRERVERYLLEQAGLQFDPAVVAAFLRILANQEELQADQA